MMLKKILILLLVQLSLISKLSSSENIIIVGKIANKIITSYDVEKEASYLKILNPNLEQLETQKIKDIAKKSLINEIIKKEEIKKFLDLTRDNPLEDQMLGNLYNKLNIEQEAFENILSYNKTYTINEVKEKLKVEIFWNDLIYLRYKNQVKIDKNSLLKKIESISNDKVKEYSLLEIIKENVNHGNP